MTEEKNEFEQADDEAGVALLPPRPMGSGLPSKSIVEYRKELLSKYYEGSPSLIERIRAAGREDSEALIVALIDEVIKEADNLLGNELVATENGELRDASIISFKRSEVLEKAIKAMTSKQQYERGSGVDVDSPAMMVVYRFFLAKAADTFNQMNVGSEISDLFFRTIGEVMDDWKKELRENLEGLRNKR